MANNLITTTLPVGQYLSMVRSADGTPIDVLIAPPGSVGPIDAGSVTYTPGDPLDWQIPPPTTVQDALDQLANITEGYNENPSGIAAAVSITPVSIVNLVPQKAGVYLVWAQSQCDGTGTTAGVCTCTLLVDAVPVGQPSGVGYAPGSWVVVPSLFTVVAVNRAVPHTWSAKFDSNSAALFGVQQQRARLMVLEL